MASCGLQQETIERSQGKPEEGRPFSMGPLPFSVKVTFLFGGQHGDEGEKQKNIMSGR